jgi:hypothetical protein
MCAFSKRRWVAERNYVKEASTINRANQAAFEWLKKERVIVETELGSLKVAYSSLKEQIQGVILQLGYNDKLL